MAVITINEGTATSTPADSVGTLKYPISKIDVGAAGSTVPWQGTVTVGGGTISAGTVTVSTGTVNTVGLVHSNRFGTVVNSGTSTLGTIIAGTAGTAIYVTDLIISVGSASNIAIYDGGTANLLLGTLSFAANGGAVLNQRTPLVTTSGSSLVYQQSANGPLSITCLGYRA